MLENVDFTHLFLKGIFGFLFHWEIAVPLLFLFVAWLFLSAPPIPGLAFTRVCPACGGRIVKKYGRYGGYWACGECGHKKRRFIRIRYEIREAIEISNSFQLK